MQKEFNKIIGSVTNTALATGLYKLRCRKVVSKLYGYNIREFLLIMSVENADSNTLR